MVSLFRTKPFELAVLSVWKTELEADDCCAIRATNGRGFGVVDVDGAAEGRYFTLHVIVLKSGRRPAPLIL